MASEFLLVLKLVKTRLKTVQQMTLLYFSYTTPSPNVLPYSSNCEKHLFAITLVHTQQIKQPFLFFYSHKQTPAGIKCNVY